LSLLIITGISVYSGIIFYQTMTLEKYSVTLSKEKTDLQSQSGSISLTKDNFDIAIYSFVS